MNSILAFSLTPGMRKFTDTVSQKEWAEILKRSRSSAGLNDPARHPETGGHAATGRERVDSPSTTDRDRQRQTNLLLLPVVVLMAGVLLQCTRLALRMARTGPVIWQTLQLVQNTRQYHIAKRPMLLELVSYGTSLSVPPWQE